MLKIEIFRKEGEGEKSWYWRFLDNGREAGKGAQSYIKLEALKAAKRASSAAEKFAELLQRKKEGIEFNGLLFEYGADGERYFWVMKDKDAAFASGAGNLSKGDKIKDVLENVCKDLGRAGITWEKPEYDPAYQEKHDDSTKTEGIPGS